MWYYKDHVWLHGYKMFRVYLKIPAETSVYSLSTQTLKNLENVLSIRTILKPATDSNLKELITSIWKTKHIEAR
jgi:hypothetical protein